MSEELIKRLREQAAEIAKAGHNGWGNTMMDAADALSRAPAVQVPEGHIKALHAAVAALYFDDSSDFGPALWAVVANLNPAIAELLERDESAAFHAVKVMLAAAPTPAPVATEAVAQGVVANAPCGGVDVEKVMALVERYGAANARFGNGFGAAAANEAVAILSELRALLASAPAVPVGDGWMPIETAPKDGTVIIATGFNYGKSSEPRHYCMALWEQGEWREASEWNGHSSLAYLTHWQPLPPAPAATKKEEGE